MRSSLLAHACLLFSVGCGSSAVGPSGSPTNGTVLDAASGRLPPGVIQKVVREKFVQFRSCYEVGLARDPTLKGHVSVRFAIERDGSTSHVEEGQATLPDVEVRRCLLGAFSTLRFPQPEHGVVTVVYPIQFSPIEGQKREGECVIDAKVEAGMLTHTMACPHFAVMTAVMKTEQGVNETFATRHLGGFEQNATGERARPELSGKTGWSSTIMGGAGKMYRKLLIFEHMPGWAVLVSCQDGLAREASPECEKRMGEAVDRWARGPAK